MRKSITAVILSMLILGSFGLMPILANADTQIQKLSVRMRGIITHWGSDPAFGWVNAFAMKANVNGTPREWAAVNAIWSLDRPHLNCTKPPTENFTFSFYIARLTKTSMIAFNYSGYDFYISGFWNVDKITTSVYVDASGELVKVEKTIELILKNATGELRVLPHSSQMLVPFEIAIEGMPLIGGVVVMWRIFYMEIKICDVNDDDKVDLIDLIRVAKSYKAVPGTPHYAIERDFNFDCVIDIGDITTLAANIEA